jgi:tellurite resistance protein TerC
VTVLLLGLVMIVTPGPAIVVIPVGLAILSIEFTWARIWLKRLRKTISRRNVTGRNNRAEAHRRRATD